jgi:hypothetical protein
MGCSFVLERKESQERRRNADKDKYIHNQQGDQILNN